jgi:hypothetical protein
MEELPDPSLTPPSSPVPFHDNDNSSVRSEAHASDDDSRAFSPVSTNEKYTNGDDESEDDDDIDYLDTWQYQTFFLLTTMTTSILSTLWTDIKIIGMRLLLLQGLVEVVVPLSAAILVLHGVSHVIDGIIGMIDDMGHRSRQYFSSPSPMGSILMVVALPFYFLSLFSIASVI